MPNWLKTLLRILGFAEKEYHHVMSSFSKAIDDLDKISVRKTNEASKHQEAAAELIAKSEAANQDAQQASSTAAGIREAFRLPAAA